MSSADSASGSLSKWQLALVVGAPVAVGLGYMCYKNYTKPGEEQSGCGKPKRGQVRENGEKQISIDGDINPTKPGVKEVVETPHQKAQKFKTEGNKYFNSGKYDEAIAQYTLAITTCPEEYSEDLATYYQNRAAAHEKLQKFNSVKADCTKALELNPKYVKALIRRAKAMEATNELEKALEDITAACILERFSNTNAVFTADKILKLLGKQHADEFIANKKPVMPSKHFISTYFVAFYNDPLVPLINNLKIENDDTPFFKALQAVKNQDYDDVIPLCTEDLNNLDSDDNSIRKMQVLLLRGTFNLLLGQYDKALPDLTTVINSESASKELKVNALIKRASMHVQLEDPLKSFKDFEEAVKLDPDCGDIYHNRGQVNLLLDKIDEAKADFSKAVELNPGFGVAYVQKCYADYRHAIMRRDVIGMNVEMNKFNEAFEKFPDCSECYTLYAQILADSQDFAKADEYFQKASEKDPKNATMLVQRGLLHIQWKQDIDQAVKYIKRAIELDDKCEFAYETLGTIEVQRGNLIDAIALFDKALALARTTMELIHIFTLRDAAKAQLVASERYGNELLKSLQAMHAEL